ncbi:hypothetical protein R1T14_19025 [Flavitalea sp. BT771]|nr:hypothetical protein [Flavitalea sp. BT771]MDV6221612.1 hypothetical protein [Flavitalea sp. BT771]
MDPARFFSIKSGDTACLLNRERLIIHHEPFILTTARHIDLPEIRYKKLKEFYLNLLGREEFIKILGGGKSMKEAKKNMMECRLPDINIR